MAIQAAALLLGISVAAVGILVALDPFALSPLSVVPDLQISYVELHKKSEQQEKWGFDPTNKLSNASVVAVLRDAVGPESLAFDSHGRGPYTGVSDGRILAWEASNSSWIDFAVTSSNRIKECVNRGSAAPHARPELEHICGRPLGLKFWKETGQLFVADAYFGLMSVGPEGGTATKILDEAEGVPFRFTNDLDFDEEGNIYFTDSSSVFRRRHFILSLLSGDNTGRLMKYDPKKGAVAVLLRGLRFANGVAISKDYSFLLVAETTNCRILRYWLEGPNKGSSEVFALLPGFPDNVRRTPSGDFWVALHCRRNSWNEMILSNPSVVQALFRLPLSMKHLHYLFTGGSQRGTAIRLNGQGKIVEVLEDHQGSTVKFISEIEEKDNRLWMGSVIVPSITVYQR